MKLLEEIKSLLSIKETECTDEFIRKSSDKESNSNTHKRRAMNSIPDKEGHEVVYKPYGSSGKGFYYTKRLSKVGKYS
jgi:hypothetical protein